MHRSLIGAVEVSLTKAARIANLTNRDNQYTKVVAAAAATTKSQPEAAKFVGTSRRSVQRAANSSAPSKSANDQRRHWDVTAKALTAAVVELIAVVVVDDSQDGTLRDELLLPEG